MKASPHFIVQPDWVEGDAIDVEQNQFLRLVISIKEQVGKNNDNLALIQRMIVMA